MQISKVINQEIISYMINPNISFNQILHAPKGDTVTQYIYMD